MTKISPKPKNEQNIPKIQKMSKIPLKPKNDQTNPKYPPNIKNDQNTSESKK